jgi:hypothetical protein
MGLELKEHVYPLKGGETVDDVCERVIALSALPFAIESITITKTVLRVLVWEPQDKEPPYGELPHEPADSIGSVLQRVPLHEVNPSGTTINTRALAVIVEMLMKARAEELAGVAWVVGDTDVFCQWLRIPPTPVRFLELPLMQYEALPPERVVLLCSRSAKHTPMDATLGIVATAFIEEGPDAEM